MCEFHTDPEKFIQENSATYTGAIYRYVKRHRNPWDPSGSEGRFNGQGTATLYFGIDPHSAWREVKYHVPDAELSDFELWEVDIVEMQFVDVGLSKHVSQFLKGSAEDGWKIPQKVSQSLSGTTTAGFRYPSYPANQQDVYGTCFCVYTDIVPMSRDIFHRSTWTGSGTTNLEDYEG